MTLTRAGLLGVLILILAAPPAAGADNPKKEADAEMKFGFKAARRGYWQEALMRFEHANELTPNQARILNNIAVAQEANGLYEQALITYQTGLEIEPGNSALRKNDQRFQEFYSSYIAPPEDDEATGGTGSTADDATSN
jgi:tetratricopeptide (TPR) repeat protein